MDPGDTKCGHTCGHSDGDSDHSSSSDNVVPAGPGNIEIDISSMESNSEVIITGSCHMISHIKQVEHWHNCIVLSTIHFDLLNVESPFSWVSYQLSFISNSKKL